MPEIKLSAVKTITRITYGQAIKAAFFFEELHTTALITGWYAGKKPEIALARNKYIAQGIFENFR